MSLEKNIERIADALERIAYALAEKHMPDEAMIAASEAAPPEKVKASKPKAEPKDEDTPPQAPEDPTQGSGDGEPAAPAVDPDDVTKEMVRKALMAYAEVSSQDAAKKLMAECGDGAKSLGMLDEDFYAPVYIAATERTAAAAGETED